MVKINTISSMIEPHMTLQCQYMRGFLQPTCSSGLYKRVCILSRDGRGLFIGKHFSFAQNLSLREICIVIFGLKRTFE